MSLFVSVSYISPATLENTLVASLPSIFLSLSSDHSKPSKQGHSVSGYVPSENLISELLTSERERKKTVSEKLRESGERGERWIDGKEERSQRNDRRWIKGVIERDCRHRALWHRQTMLFCCLWASQISLCVTPSMLWSKYTVITQHRQACQTHTQRKTHTETLAGNLKAKHASVPCTESS